MNETILWRRIDLPGHESCTVNNYEDGWRLRGTALFAHDDEPCELSYRVHCTPDWRATSARIAGRVGRRDVNLDVSADGAGSWRLNGQTCGAVDGCIDIDLGFSPCTNLLPIRRLALDVGTSANVVAAWLPFPSLTFEPLQQMYVREGERTYRYESRGGAFVRTLEVDASGLVTHYPGIWHAEAALSQE